MIARTSKETRHESRVLTTAKAIRIPTTTATKDHPQRAKPITAKAIFKTNPMLIGRLEDRVSIFFSVRFIISDLFFNRNAARSRYGVFEFRGQENPVSEVHTKACANKNSLRPGTGAEHPFLGVGCFCVKYARPDRERRERGRFFAQPTGKGVKRLGE
jgi:hypothetical protein